MKGQESAAGEGWQPEEVWEEEGTEEGGPSHSSCMVNDTLLDYTIPFHHILLN